MMNYNIYDTLLIGLSIQLSLFVLFVYFFVNTLKIKNVQIAELKKIIKIN
jgi:hypothetical protein